MYSSVDSLYRCEIVNCVMCHPLYLTVSPSQVTPLDIKGGVTYPVPLTLSARRSMALCEKVNKL